MTSLSLSTLACAFCYIFIIGRSIIKFNYIKFPPQYPTVSPKLMIFMANTTSWEIFTENNSWWAAGISAAGVMIRFGIREALAVLPSS
jgi:hypothetical protein